MDEGEGTGSPEKKRAALPSNDGAGGSYVRDARMIGQGARALHRHHSNSSRNNNINNNNPPPRPPPRPQPLSIMHSQSEQIQWAEYDSRHGDAHPNNAHIAQQQRQYRSLQLQQQQQQQPQPQQRLALQHPYDRDGLVDLTNSSPEVSAAEGGGLNNNGLGVGGLDNNGGDGRINNKWPLGLKGLVIAQLSANKVKNNPDTYEPSYLKAQLTHLVNYRSILVKYARKVDEEDGLVGDSSLRKQLREIIPTDVGKVGKMSKNSVAQKLADVWEVLGNVIFHPLVTLKAKESRDLDVYLALMQKHTDRCSADLEWSQNDQMNGKSDKMPRALAAVEKDIEWDPTKKTSREYGNGKCPCCEFISFQFAHNYHEALRRNKQKTRDWERDRQQLEDYTKGIGLPLMVGEKVATSVPNAKPENLYLVCKGHAQRHSATGDGYQCRYCTDRTCDQCKNNCMFVCTTM